MKRVETCTKSGIVQRYKLMNFLWNCLEFLSLEEYTVIFKSMFTVQPSKYLLVQVAKYFYIFSETLKVFQYFLKHLM